MTLLGFLILLLLLGVEGFIAYGLCIVALKAALFLAVAFPNVVMPIVVVGVGAGWLWCVLKTIEWVVGLFPPLPPSVRKFLDGGGVYGALTTPTSSSVVEKSDAGEPLPEGWTKRLVERDAQKEHGALWNLFFGP